MATKEQYEKLTRRERQRRYFSEEFKRKKVGSQTLRWYWLNREKQHFKMNAIYRAIGMSKQAFHQSLDRHMLHLEEEQQLLPLIREIRHDHPCMSSRVMYRFLKPAHMGRDKFEAFCFANGFKIAVKRSFIRTTNSLGVTRFENLISQWESTGINQVWVSDIT